MGCHCMDYIAVSENIRFKPVTDASSGLRRTDFLDDLGDRVIRKINRPVGHNSR